MTPKQARVHKGVNLETVSRGTGLSVSMIIKVETCNATLSQKVKERLEEYYGHSIEPSPAAYAVLESRYNSLLERYNDLLLHNMQLETKLESIKQLLEESLCH